jgi:hypothetical protein
LVLEKLVLVLQEQELQGPQLVQVLPELVLQELVLQELE